MFWKLGASVVPSWLIKTLWTKISKYERGIQQVPEIKSLPRPQNQQSVTKIILVELTNLQQSELNPNGIVHFKGYT